MKYCLIITLFLGLFFLLGADFVAHAPLPEEETAPIKTLIIDPGHGGKDPGALGARYYEKDLALQISLKLKEMLNENMPSIKVVMTREDDTFVELYRRGEIALENNGDFFISIHCNGLKNKSKFGTETYVLGINEGQETYERVIAENESILFEENYRDMYGNFEPSSPEAYIFFRLLKNVFRQESTRLADKVQANYDSQGRHGRGVKQAPFVVLYHSGMPAILTEVGFITNYEEETYLASDSGQLAISASIMEAIREYNTEF
ncbi:MAG: N-acetylmuramoyl-L-alanine amidase [Bacteroidota bacterium]